MPGSYFARHSRPYAACNCFQLTPCVNRKPKNNDSVKDCPTAIASRHRATFRLGKPPRLCVSPSDRPAPTVGGVGALDLLAGLGLVHGGSGFSGTPVSFGIGARVGVLRDPDLTTWRTSEATQLTLTRG